MVGCNYYDRVAFYEVFMGFLSRHLTCITDCQYNQRYLMAMKTKTIPGILLILLYALILSSAPVSARPVSDRYLLHGTDWLAGHGVNVIYPDVGPGNREGYVEITPFCSYAYCYQCIELTIRLYAEKLGYISNNGRWPDTVAIPNDMIDVINQAHEKQKLIKKGALSVSDSEAVKYLPFADLIYTPNGGTTPPRVGDMIIYTYRKPGDHIMVVNRVGGNKVEIVQQNIWTQSRPASPVPVRLLDLFEQSGHYFINNAEGWIHSPRMKELIEPTGDGYFFDAKLGNGTWRWTEDAFTISLERTGAIGMAADIGQESAARLSQTLNNEGAIAVTSEPYIRCALMKAANVAGNDVRFLSNFGLKGLDIRIEFTGDTLRLRPHGGKFDNQWITINNARCGWEGNPI